MLVRQYEEAPKPTITGKAKVGRTLTAHVGFEPGTFVSYRWLAAGKKIAGADSEQLVLTKAQRASRIQVRVTTLRTDYEQVVVTSAKTDAVE